MADEPQETESPTTVPLDEIDNVTIGMTRSAFLKLIPSDVGEWMSSGEDAVFSHETSLFGWDGVTSFRFGENNLLRSVRFSLSAEWYTETVSHNDATDRNWRPPRTASSGNLSMVESRCGEAEKSLSSKLVREFGAPAKPAEEQAQDLTTSEIQWCRDHSNQDCEANGNLRNKRMLFSLNDMNIKYSYSGLRATGWRHPSYSVNISMEMRKCLYQITFW